MNKLKCGLFWIQIMINLSITQAKQLCIIFGGKRSSKHNYYKRFEILFSLKKIIIRFWDHRNPVLKTVVIGISLKAIAKSYIKHKKAYSSQHNRVNLSSKSMQSCIFQSGNSKTFPVHVLGSQAYAIIHKHWLGFIIQFAKSSTMLNVKQLLLTEYWMEKQEMFNNYYIIYSTSGDTYASNPAALD